MRWWIALLVGLMGLSLRFGNDYPAAVDIVFIVIVAMIAAVKEEKE